MHRVSIVVSLYNKGQYIERALRSALAQTIQDFDIIVVNDGSSDNGPAIVDSLKDPRIRLIHQKNQGVSAARNRGIGEAQSELVAFLDADDAYKPEFLEAILRIHEKFPEAGIVCTAYEFVEPSGKVWAPCFKGIPSTPWEGIIPNYFYSALGTSPVWTSAVAVPKKVFSDVGFFAVGEKVGQDIDLWFRIALKYPIAFSNKVCATYFRDAINGACRSGVIWPDRALKRNSLKALAEELVKGKSAEYVQEYIYKKDLEVATLMLWAGQKKEAFGLLKENHTKIFFFKKAGLYFCLMIPQKVLLFLYKLKDRIWGLK